MGPFMEFHLPGARRRRLRGRNSRWLIEEGASVKPGQGLLELLTRQGDHGSSAPFAGTIDSFKVKEGDKIRLATWY